MFTQMITELKTNQFETSSTKITIQNQFRTLCKCARTTYEGGGFTDFIS